MTPRLTYRAVQRRYLKQGALYLAGWTLFGLYGVTEQFSHMRHWHPYQWRTVVAINATQACSWALLAPLVLWLSTAFPIDQLNWRRRVPLHLLFSYGLFFLQIAVYVAILIHLPAAQQLRKPTFFQLFPSALLGQLHASLLIYWIVVGLNHTFAYYRKRREREEAAMQLELNASELKSQLAEATLNALMMQLHPHFLFNTLNAIMVLVRQREYVEAEEMLRRLNDLLRNVLEDKDSQELPLRRELEHVRLYLAIQEVRFRDRLRVEIAADPEILDSPVMNMCLQPLVENAIRHGIARRPGTGMIRVSANRAPGAVKIQVEDDGAGYNSSKSLRRSGIGLANTRSRLSQLYGELSSLSVHSSAQGGTLVTIILPYRAGPPRELAGETI